MCEMRQKFGVILAMACLLSFSNNAKAQEQIFSVGPNVAFPLGTFNEFSSMGIGANFRYEYGFTENIAIGTGVELLLFFRGSYDVGEQTVRGPSSLLVPLKAYFRYYPIEQGVGPFVALNIGAYPILMVYGDSDGFPEDADANLNFGWGPELGAFVVERIGISLSYEMMYNDTKYRDTYFGEAYTTKETLQFITLKSFFCF